MAKFHGMIGYSESVEQKITTGIDPDTQEPIEVGNGVWLDEITEREYFGDILRETKQWTNSGQVNDNLVINNRISIVADDFANSNFSAMKYVIWAGVYWKISNIEIQRPRLILSLGGVYNGIKA
jgi:hypothetical protein